MSQIIPVLALTLWLVLALPGHAHADLTIVVDFNNTSAITESDGFTQAATPAAGLTAADKSAILNKIKEKYSVIAGIGAVTVREGAVGNGLGGGDYSVVISGGMGPGGWFGDAGRDAHPSIVYLGLFRAKMNMGMPVFTGVGLTNAVGETSAHEVGHRAGKFDHNMESAAATLPNTALMAAGGTVTNARRIADRRFFTAAEITAIKTNLPVRAAPHAALPARDLKAFVGTVPSQADVTPDDPSWGGLIWYTGLSGYAAGYENADNQFVFETDNQSPAASNPDFMGFLFQGTQTAAWDMALSDPSGNIFDFEHYGIGAPLLSDPNPLDPRVYQFAELDFDIGGRPFSIFLDAAGIEPTTGGFFVPEPASTFPVGLAALIALRVRYRRTATPRGGVAQA
jgi:hypothetical protein